MTHVFFVFFLAQTDQHLCGLIGSSGKQLRLDSFQEPLSSVFTAAICDRFQEISIQMKNYERHLYEIKINLRNKILNASYQFHFFLFLREREFLNLSHLYIGEDKIHLSIGRKLITGLYLGAFVDSVTCLKILQHPEGILAP